MIRRPQFNIPMVGNSGEAVRQWVDFFSDLWMALKLIGGVYTVSSTIDFGSVAAHSTATTTVTVTGAALGSHVAVTTPVTVDNGMSYDGYVSALNTVTVRAINSTAGAIDPASGDYRIVVITF